MEKRRRAVKPSVAASEKTPRRRAQIPGLGTYIVACAQTGIEIRKISNLDATRTRGETISVCIRVFSLALCHSHVSSFPQTRV